MARGIKKGSVPYLVAIRSIWHYERSVPPGTVWNGKPVKRIRVSLGTQDKAEAVTAWALVHTAAESAIADAGRGTFDPAEFKALTEAIREERDERKRRALQDRQRVLLTILRDNPPPNRVFDSLQGDEVAGLVHSASRILGRLDALGHVSATTPLHEVAGMLAGGQLGEMAQAQIKEEIPHLLIPEAVKPYVALSHNNNVVSDRNITLQQLIDRFFIDPARAHLDVGTRRNYTATFDILTEVLGGATPIRAIDRDAIKRVQNVIINLPPRAKDTKAFAGMTYEEIASAVLEAKQNGEPIKALMSGTRNKYLSNIGTLFQYAYEEGKITANPALSLQVKLPEDRGEEDAEPFSADQLNIMFPKTYRLVGNNWIPLVMLFSGMRPGECSQLDVADIVERDGVWCFHITDETAGKTGEEKYADKKLKNDSSSKRFTPVHQRLIDLGFMAYVQERKKGGFVKLFNTKRYGVHGYYPSVNDEFTAWLVGIGVKNDRNSPHSFRHTWNTCAYAKVDDKLRKIMGGWTLGKGVDVQTYLHTEKISAKTLKSEIDKVDFDVMMGEAVEGRHHDGLIARKRGQGSGQSS